ncbi:hypothetical protein M405DRAFT_818490 [Rhizopogon salebrosus TDB-379]|nr:hypothetical protein M405DRAFT_818490 [Rhizopogon salebrosus TDB-379]
MYELDKRLASASMFVRLLFFLSRGMSIGNSVIMSIADSRSSNSSHPRPMAILRTSTSNLTWWMQTRPTGNVLASACSTTGEFSLRSVYRFIVAFMPQRLEIIGIARHPSLPQLSGACEWRGHVATTSVVGSRLR